MRIDLPPSALAAGMSNEPAGTHTSRTIMLDEFGQLLASCPPEATYDDYATAVVDDNVLRKKTLATRRKSLRHLRELYALRAEVPLFAALRALWPDNVAARPLMAAMCSAARDPLLRSTIDILVATSHGTKVASEVFRESLGSSFPGRFSPGVLGRISRNVASSWTQSEHLRGRYKKVRVAATATPASVSYALYLGHLAGETGAGLLRTPWALLLDASEGDARTLAAAASRLGWINYRSAAEMTEVTFRHLDGLTSRVLGEAR
jgi:hypothetical protein